MSYVKEPHRAIISGKTNTSKTKLALDLIETEYKNYFDFIVIICPTIMLNETYLERSWIWTNDDIFVIPSNNVLPNLENYSNKFFKNDLRYFC